MKTINALEDHPIFKDFCPEQILADSDNGSLKNVGEYEDIICLIRGHWDESGVRSLTLINPLSKSQIKPYYSISPGVNITKIRDGIEIQAATIDSTTSCAAVHITHNSNHIVYDKSCDPALVAKTLKKCWDKKSEIVKSLQFLNATQLYPLWLDGIRSILKTKQPYYQNKDIIKNITDRLKFECFQHPGEPSFFDLYLSIIWVANNSPDISNSHYLKLRSCSNEIIKLAEERKLKATA